MPEYVYDPEIGTVRPVEPEDYETPVTGGTGTGDRTTSSGGDDKFVVDEIVDKVVQGITAPSAPKYSTAEPESYRWARARFADEFGVNQADLTYRLNALANLWYDQYGRFPTGTEMYQWNVARNSVYTFASGMSQLPGAFDLVGDDGTVTTYFNDPVRGLMPDPNQGIDLEYMITGVQAGKRPTYQSADLPSILAGLSPARGGAAGGGGGGGGRAALAWDRRQLMESARERWRGVLLEEAGDDTLTKHITDYINESNSFWINEGGRLDFDAFLMERIRATDRHKLLYKQKADFQSEAEYISGYRNAVSQFGLNPNTAIKQVESGAKAGAGLEGFTERVGRSAEVRAASTGSFSQRFAQMMAASGMRGT